MVIFLGLLAVFTAIMVNFSDRILEYYMTNGEFSKMWDKVDNLMVMLDEQDDVHSSRE